MCINFITKKELQHELNKLKLRFGRSQDKLSKIERIIERADATHEMAIFTVKDIERVLTYGE